MSEQWWFVMPFGEYVLPKVQHSESDAISFSLRRGGGRVVRGRIVEDAGPCEWELSPSPWASFKPRLAEVGGEPNPRTMLNLLTGSGYNFCPNCGRSLKEE